MIGKIFTPEESTVTLSIPGDLVGKKVKVIAFALEEEAAVIEGLAAELQTSQSDITTPQWQKDLVLAEKKRIEQNPELLVSWEQVKNELGIQ